MPRPMSRAHRRAAFLDAAQLFDELDTWYDQHPDATFILDPMNCTTGQRGSGSLQR